MQMANSERMVGQQEVIQMGIERFKDEPSGNQGWSPDG